MFSITNYSLFYINEFKYRFFHIVANILCILFFVLINMNLLILFLLKPLEYLNVDLDLQILSTFIWNTLLSLYLFDISNLNICSISNFDYYPVLEINLKTNSFLFFSIIKYYIFLLCFPLLFYNLFMFFSNCLYKHEKEKLFFISFLYFFIFFIYIFFFDFILNVFYFSINYNNYHEFFHFEFDLEFDLYNYIQFKLNSLFTFYIYFFSYIYVLYKKKNIFVYLCFFHIFFSPFFFIFLIYSFSYFIFFYFILFFSYIK